MKQSGVLLLAVVLTVSLGHAAEEKAPDAAKPLLGSWRNEKDKQSFVRFETDRATFSENGKLEFQAVSYAPGKVLLHDGEDRKPIDAKVAGDLLTLTMPDGKERTYRKLETLPPELELKPLKLGEAKELAADKVKEIHDDLIERRKTDQEVRKNPAKNKDLKKVDADNTAQVIKLVKEFGWIDAGRFGADASHAAFLIVQHSGNLPLMMAALPSIEKDVKAMKFGDGQPYALLYDRLQLMLGKKQKYGTQIGQNAKGEYYVMPLEDRAKVEEFRKEIGVKITLANYLRIYQQLTGKEVKFLEK